MPIAKEQTTFEPAPSGTHIARCYGCIALGTQPSQMYADNDKVMLMFELPHEMIETEQGPMPMTQSKEYTLSLGLKSNLRKDLDSWRGRPFTPEDLKGFEVSKVVGAPCQITIVHAVSGTGNKYAKIASITGLAKGMTCPPAVHPPIKFEVADGRNATYRALPEWIQKKLEMCHEWKHAPQAQGHDESQASDGSDESDGVPF